MVGDIIQCSADVIVNPANSRLENGGGVTGAIWRAGGQEIGRECSDYFKKNSELRPGQVFVSTAGTMSFKKVVHTVGPKWKEGKNNEDRDLGLAVTAALRKSDELGVRSVAIPAISCGIYGFPVEKAATIILRSILDVLKSSKTVRVVHFVSGEENVRKFHDVLSRLTTTISSHTSGTSEELYETLDNGNTEAEYDMVELPRGGGGRDDSSSNSFRTEEGIDIAVIIGSITAQKTDVIFCSSDKDLALGKGAVSKSISEEAGPGLSSECMTKYPKGINYGDVVKTGAYNLKCRQVYHGVCPRWDNGAGRTENTLRRLIRSSLELASSDRMTSIAFPSIGTGNLKIPHDVVAKAMLDETVRFSAACGSRTSVKSVSIILFNKDQQTIDAFHKEVDQMNRKWGPQDYRTPNQPQHGAPRQHLPPSSDRSGITPKLECRVGNVTLTVKIGDITQERCDAIVNSTNERLDVTVGALSKAIIQAGGTSIVDECKSLGKLTDGMAVTSAGNLPCTKIFHLFAKPSTKAWKDVIQRCFAEAERLKLTSLAMPPLGTGHAKACSPAEIAEAIFEELSDFSRKNPNFLRQITIMVKQPGMLNDFIAAIEKAEKAGGSSEWKILTKVKEFFQGMLPSPVEPESHAERHRPPKKYATAGKPVPAPRRAGSAILVIRLYSMSDSHIDKAVTEIKKTFEAAIQSKVLNNEKVMSCLTSFTKEQETQIKDIEKQHDVKIAVDKRTGIQIAGHQDGLSSAVAAVYEVLFDQKNKELENRERSLLAKQAEWTYDTGNGTPTLYDALSSGTLEKAYQDKKKTAEWTDANGVRHRVSLHHWHDDIGSGTKYKVARKVPGQISLPEAWDLMLPTETVKLVQLKTGSNEYKKVETHLTSTGKVNSIVKIERIQNPRLYKLYVVAKMEMDQKRGTTNNEQRLWHGTAGSNVANINENNFNRNYGGAHGLSIGNGVYFSTTSQYSINGYSPADASGTKYIYQARVLSGKIGAGQAGIREPPAGCDSVGNSQMVVIFYDAQAYPEYLITFN